MTICHKMMFKYYEWQYKHKLVYPFGSLDNPVSPSQVFTLQINSHIHAQDNIKNVIEKERNSLNFQIENR